MNIKMKVNGKSEFNNGTTITTNITLTPVTDTSAAVQAQGSITLVTQDQTFADSINFRDVLELEISNTSTATSSNTAS